MKLRIKGNSLRYRITRGEMKRLEDTGSVEERVNFGVMTLTYALCKTDASVLSATFEANRITLYLPAELIEEWAHTDRVGFDRRIPLPDSDESLYILVEKDFTCLDNVEEDQSDNYPNPLLKKTV